MFEGRLRVGTGWCLELIVSSISPKRELDVEENDERPGGKSSKLGCASEAPLVPKGRKPSEA